MTKKLVMLAAVAALALPVAVQAQEASWVHVRVDAEDGTRVRLNLPVSMVDVALKTAREEGFEDAHLRWDEHADLSLEDLRRLWREMRDAGDAEFVNIQDEEEHVRIFRRGDRVFVHVDEDGTEKVRVEMPVEVADALLETEGDELDLSAAVQKLARRGEHELVRVRDRDATVRIWVDDSNSQASDGSM